LLKKLMEQLDVELAAPEPPDSLASVIPA
jgi:hypothetical protein